MSDLMPEYNTEIVNLKNGSTLLLSEVKYCNGLHYSGSLLHGIFVKNILINIAGSGNSVTL